jgi:glycine cleavage system H protein
MERKIFLERKMAYPNEYKYTKEHEWIKVEGKTGVIGITDHAQEALGDIVFVELPKVGAMVQAGKSFGTVESVKAVSDIYSPVTGTVAEVNNELTTAPEKINQDANHAWMIKVQLKDSGEVNSLMSAADYEKFLKEEEGH